MILSKTNTIIFMVIAACSIAGCYDQHPHTSAGMDASVPMTDTSIPVMELDLRVELASTNPAGSIISPNASSVALASFSFTAGVDDVTITALRVHRVGVGAGSDFANVFLRDANGTRLTVGRAINSQTNVIAFNNVNLVIPAGQARSFLLVGDMASPAITGGQHLFQITDVTSVDANVVVSGNFPVAGNTITVGSLQATRIDVRAADGLEHPDAQAQNAEIARFTMTAGERDAVINSLTLLQAGSVSMNSITNLQLYNESQLVASTPSIQGDKIVFHLLAGTMVLAESIETFSLRADINAPAGRTIRIHSEYPTDVSATDVLLNGRASVCIDQTLVHCSGSLAGYNGINGEYSEVVLQP
jgi:hypothetical protein